MIVAAPAYVCPVCRAVFLTENVWREHLSTHRMPAVAIVMVGDVPVIPIEVPPPPAIPFALPSPGPIINYLSAGEHAVWNDVWGWIKGAAADAKQGLSNLDQTIVGPVISVVEAYVGSELKALSGYVNDTFSWAADGFGQITDTVSSVLSDELSNYEFLSNELVDIDTLLGEVVGTTIPNIEDVIAAVAGSIGVDVLDGLANVETWAIDNIYDPLVAEVAAVAEGARVDVVTVAGEIYDAVKAEINAETLARIAAIAGLATAISALTTFVDECAEPMCSSFGPKTDLGKFLKALSVASDAALFLELANLDDAGLNSLIQSFQGLSSGIIDEFDTLFLGGGATLSKVASTVAAKL